MKKYILRGAVIILLIAGCIGVIGGSAARTEDQTAETIYSQVL